MGFRNREERERYMDSLEQQMERTLDQTKGSGRLRTVLETLRDTLPSFPRRASTRHGRERGVATERLESEAPRSWWKIWQ